MRGNSAFAGFSRVGSEMVMSAEEARTPRNVTPMQSVRNVRALQAAWSLSSILPLTVNCGLELPFERMVSMYVHWSSGTMTSAVAQTCPQLSHLRCLLMAFSPEWRTCVTRPMPLVSWMLHLGHFIKTQANQGCSETTLLPKPRGSRQDPP